MQHLQIFNWSLIDDRCWQNERGIESYLMKQFIEAHQGENLVEVGATSPYYYPCNHLVIDPYDPYEKSIRMDGEEYDYTNCDVLCISTVEHAGKCDYGNTDIDPDKAIRLLTKIEQESRSCLITFPIGGNDILDQWIFNNRLEVDGYARINYNPPIWLQCNVAKDMQDCKYNTPFPNGNGLVVIQKG